MTTEPDPVADATPDVDAVMQQNIELRAALASYVDGDLEEHLDTSISFARDGTVRYTPAVEPGSADDNEGDSPADPSTEAGGEPPSSAATPPASPKPPVRTRPRPSAPGAPARGNAHRDNKGLAPDKAIKLPDKEFRDWHEHQIAASAAERN